MKKTLMFCFWSAVRSTVPSDPVKSQTGECGLVLQQRASRQASSNFPVGTSRARGEEAEQL